MCVQKVAKKDAPVEGTVSLFLCHPPIRRPAACGRSRRTSASSGSSARRGGLEEARLESGKTVFCVPSLVASDSCHDQASAWLLGDIAETEKSSSVADHGIVPETTATCEGQYGTRRRPPRGRAFA